MRKQKITKDVAQQKLDEIGAGLTIVGNFINAKLPCDVKCQRDHQWPARIDNLIYGRQGCPFCSGKRVWKGYNDLWTERPDVAILLKDPEDGYVYRHGANVHLWFTCPDCGVDDIRQLAHISAHGFVCHNCGYGSIKSTTEYIETKQKWFQNKLSGLDRDVYTDDIFINTKTAMDFYCSKGHHWPATPGSIFDSHTSCPYCTGHKPIVGETDLWTTRPDVARFLKNPEDGYVLMKWSNQYADFTCPNCGTIHNKLVNNVSRNGLSCSVCGDGISYPNKLMANVLSQLNIKFKPEYKIPGYKYKYDFWLIDYAIVVEMHGSQHYEECSLTNRTLTEEQENDKEKCDLATSKGLRYIAIDSRYSLLDFIKANLECSELNEILDFSAVDWATCEEYAGGSNIKLSAKLYNDGYTFRQIMSELHASKSAVTTWLNKADNAGLCKWEKHNGFKDRAKPVVCLNYLDILPSLSKAEKKYGVARHVILECCNHIRDYAGIDPSTGDELHWILYDEYINTKQND